MNAPADSADVRRRNLALVLRYLDAHGPCARTEVAAGTGLVHATVTALVTELIDRGLVAEAGSVPSAGRGRPRRLLRLVPERVVILAAQVSLESVHVLAADFRGRVLHRESAPHHAPYGDPRALAAVIGCVVRSAEAAVRDATPHAHLAQLAVAMAGPVVGTSQLVAAAIDFGWHSTDLRSLVVAELPLLDCPVDVVNDANMAALAEYHALAADGVEHPDTVAYIKADTGVGGGLLVNGRVHSGSHGMAGEIGHLPISLDGPNCRCGTRGCLAMYIGPEPLIHAAGLDAVAESEGGEAALAKLDRRLRAGDPAAVAALGAAGHALGAAVLGVSGVTDAGEIILGGYLATWASWLAPGLDERLAGRRALAPDMQPLITFGVLGGEATLRGAFQTCRDALLDDPTSVPALARTPIPVPSQ
ncbi:ROK family transcriptional regulator [Streptomyces sp. NRRL F-525]|uniref:ROK family transcriptional regulator n=1 Tax=Streptomyces sp. NRRL F-525 TaxID=1463861 RepID=UPI000527DA89|nr:ROK family transcriptional regulator [Streptomyces sp. NRRL F-525]